MTTWTGGNANVRRTSYIGGNIIQKTYSIAGINGDTGGTLTCSGLKQLKDHVTNVYTAAAGVAAANSYISGNTIVVTYLNPVAAHTVRITVWGMKN